MRIERVTASAFDRPELAPYATLRQHEEHRRAGIFVAEGARVVQRLLESEFGVVSVLLPEKRLAGFEPLIRARPEDVPVFVMEIAELEKLTGFPFFQGILAVGRIPRLHTLDDLLANQPRPWLFVAMDALANAENVGLVVRNAAALGAQALLLDHTSSSPYLRRAVRNSMGSIFKLPVVEMPELVPALERLKASGVRCFAAHPHASSRTIHECDFTRDCCFVLGSEGLGISEPVRAACDECIVIPMQNEVDSLNVASASAVLLYEAARQRARASTNAR